MREERHARTGRAVYVRSHDIKARALEVEVGVDVDDGIVAELDALRRVLQGELTYDGRIGRGVVFGEIAYVAADLRTEHFGNLEFEV